MTLPTRELSAGLAEVIKYGIIWDADFFTWLEQHMAGLMALDTPLLIQTILRCCTIKADVVSQDETETGVRALLNLGHTFGHAIEAEQGYGNWLHGEAVAAGTVLAAETSLQLGLLTQEQVERVQRLLAAARLPLCAPSNMGFPVFMRHMMRDKKVLAGKLRLILPTTIGHAELFSDVSESVLQSVIEMDRLV
jgi:3-dehydroquinate synthase